MKLFATIFAAVLLAGLCIFGVQTCQRRAVSEWQSMASAEVKLMRICLESGDYDFARDPASLESAAARTLGDAPFGAEKSELESALADVRSRKRKH